MDYEQIPCDSEICDDGHGAAKNPLFFLSFQERKKERKGSLGLMTTIPRSLMMPSLC
jgi:hypothetical protein